MKKLLIATLLTLATLGAAQAAPITVGEPTLAGNCFPFSCLASKEGTQYQQVYTADAFSGAGTIDGISLYRAIGGGMDGATFTLYLSTTSAQVNALNGANLNANLGADNTLFGQYTIGGEMPEVLRFDGLPFHYDPAAGNLLLNVLISAPTATGVPTSYFQADGRGSVTSRALAAGGISGADAAGLVTTFDFTPDGEVPEPASLLLVGAGLAVLARTRRGTRSSA